MMPWAAYLGIGALVGFAAGLLGIGGGVVMVPLLVLVFTGQGLPPEHVLHVALGTAMAAMVFTSLASMRAHHAHGAVDWPIARAMSPGILAGSFAAALLAGFIPTRPLALLFTALVFYAATQILLDLKPPTTRELPGAAGIFTAGAVIGAVLDPRRPESARVVTASRALDLDHLGAEISHVLARPRSGEHARQIENADMRKGSGHGLRGR